METKLSSIKLAIYALNERADVLQQKIDKVNYFAVTVADKHDDELFQYAEELENCRVAIEDMKRLLEQVEFGIAINNPTNTGGFDPTKHPLPWKRTLTDATLDEQ